MNYTKRLTFLNKMTTNLEMNNLLTDRRVADNSGLAKGGLTSFDETFVLKQTFGGAIKVRSLILR